MEVIGVFLSGALNFALVTQFFKQSMRTRDVRVINVFKLLEESWFNNDRRVSNCLSSVKTGIATKYQKIRCHQENCE